VKKVRVKLEVEYFLSDGCHAQQEAEQIVRELREHAPNFGSSWMLVGQVIDATHEVLDLTAKEHATFYGGPGGGG
jgi:hypothetical protein